LEKGNINRTEALNSKNLMFYNFMTMKRPLLPYISEVCMIEKSRRRTEVDEMYFQWLVTEVRLQEQRHDEDIREELQSRYTVDWM